MFKVCFVDKSPPNETEIDSWGPHPITDGESNQFLRVLCRYSWKAGKFNVRFLDLEELSLGPGESLIDVRPIIKIVGVQLPPEVQAQGISVIPIDDEKGGFDIVLRPPLELAAWEPLTLTLRVESASQPWSGKISFRGLDNEGNRRPARKDVVTGVQAKSVP